MEALFQRKSTKTVMQTFFWNFFASPLGMPPFTGSNYFKEKRAGVHPFRYGLEVNFNKIIQ